MGLRLFVAKDRKKHPSARYKQYVNQPERASTVTIFIRLFQQVLFTAGVGMAILAVPDSWAQQIGAQGQTPGQTFDLPSMEQWQKLTPEERRVQRGELRKRFEALAPEQRSEIKSEIRRRFEQLSPEDRERLANQARDEWRSMSPEQREKLRADRRAQIKKLSPEERKKLFEERRRLWEKLTPEERERLFKEML